MLCVSMKLLDNVPSEEGEAYTVHLVSNTPAAQLPTLQAHIENINN